MKHLKLILKEFVKSAAWEQYSRPHQEEYLRHHPQSRLRPTSHSPDTCSSCGHQLNVKDHSTWEGYHCPHCGLGGSRQKHHRPRYRPQYQQPREQQQQSQPRQSELVPKQVVDIKPDYYFKDRNLFSFELSEVPQGVVATDVVYLRNPKTGNEVKFKKYKTDRDASNEDIYGWHYTAIDDNGNPITPKLELLIIND